MRGKKVFCSTPFFFWTDQLWQRLADLGHEKEKLVDGNWSCFNHVLLYFVLLFLGTDQLRQRLADLGHEKEKLVDEVDHVSNMNKNLVDQIGTKISGLENQTKDIKAQYILGEWALSYFLALEHSIPSWLVLVENRVYTQGACGSAQTSHKPV